MPGCGIKTNGFKHKSHGGKLEWGGRYEYCGKCIGNVIYCCGCF